MAIVAFKTMALFGVSPYSGTRLWPILGSTPTEIISSLLIPSRVVAALSYDFYRKVAYVLLLLAPLMFLPLGSPLELLLCLPWLSVSLLSQYRYFYEYGGFHSGGFLAPFIIYSALNTIKKGQISRELLKKLAIFSIIVSLLLTPLNPMTTGQFPGQAYADYPKMSEHEVLIHKVLKLIPKNASVLAQNNIFPHVCNRLEAYVWLPPEKRPEYIIVDIKNREFQLHIWYPFHTGMQEQVFSRTFQELWQTGEYGLLASADGVLLLKRGYRGRLAIYSPITITLDHDDLFILNGYKISDPTSKSKTVLIHSPQNQKGTFWYGPYATLPPGNYTAKFYIKITEPTTDLVLTLDITTQTGAKILARKQVYGWELKPKTWQEITINFTLNDLELDVEFRGICQTSNTTILLDCIKITQTSSPEHS